MKLKQQKKNKKAAYRNEKHVVVPSFFHLNLSIFLPSIPHTIVSTSHIANRSVAVRYEQKYMYIIIHMCISYKSECGEDDEKKEEICLFTNS